MQFSHLYTHFQWVELTLVEGRSVRIGPDISLQLDIRLLLSREKSTLTMAVHNHCLCVSLQSSQIEVKISLTSHNALTGQWNCHSAKLWVADSPTFDHRGILQPILHQEGPQFHQWIHLRDSQWNQEEEKCIQKSSHEQVPYNPRMGCHYRDQRTDPRLATILLYFKIKKYRVWYECGTHQALRRIKAIKMLLLTSCPEIWWRQVEHSGWSLPFNKCSILHYMLIMRLQSDKLPGELCVT